MIGDSSCSAKEGGDPLEIGNEGYSTENGLMKATFSHKNEDV